MAEAHSRLETYATVTAEISAGATREDVLAKYGLDETAWSEIETDIETQLSRAMDSNIDGVPTFIVEYDAAMRRAQAVALGQTNMTLEQFARGVAILQRPTNDPAKALSRLGMSPIDLIRALQKWGPALAKDPALASEFEAMRMGRPAGSTPTGSTPTGSTPTGSTPTGSTPTGSTPGSTTTASPKKSAEE